MSEQIAIPDPDICWLKNTAFATLRAPVFRRSAADGIPMLLISLGARDAAFTLPAMQRQLGIVDDSADGRMLALIAQALEYVHELRLGDRLPTELSSGAASWEATPEHLRRTILRLRRGLLADIDDGIVLPVARHDAALERAEADPAMRRRIQSAFGHAARTLGLRDGEAVIPLLGAIAHELAFIEALRERLLVRLQAAARTIGVASHGWRGDEYHRDMLIQSRRLMAIAVANIADRFGRLAGQCESVMAMLRDIAAHQALIRSSRDWLYRTQRAFEPLLTSWDTAPQHIDDSFWARIATTYRFLAPRFMPSQQWPNGRRASNPTSVHAR